MTRSVDDENGGAAAARSESADESVSPELEQHGRHVAAVIGILRDKTVHDFHPYRKSMLLRRIQRRMTRVGYQEIDAYAAHLGQTPEEAEGLAEDLLIGVTGFFRDPLAWEALRTDVVRPLVQNGGTKG